MQSRWSQEDAERAIETYGAQGYDSDLALRVYTTRLLGSDPTLVLHGGGNTSVKTRATDLLGDRIDVLCVKGSGWDMARIEPAGLPAVRLEPLRRVRQRDRLSDEDMVNLQRTNLLDANAPNPSVEALFHAFLPHKFVDHTHATAVLALTDQPDGESITRDVYGDRVALVPYIMPGFALAKLAAEIYEAQPVVEGLVLLKHGIFSFGQTAREAYERMIDLVTLAEHRVAQGRKTVIPIALPDGLAPVERVAPILRGCLAEARGDGVWRRQILAHRSNNRIMTFVNGAEVARYALAGVATPDHVLRTKGWPVLLPPPVQDGLDDWAATAKVAVDRYAEGYQAYFARHNPRQSQPKTMLDPKPRVALVPGLGLFAAGKSAADAEITADIAEAWIETVLSAEAIAQFESITEADLFDMEYWSLEQAKLGKAAEKPLARQVVVVTGGAGTIGHAVATAFRREGAEIVLLDKDADQTRAAAASLGSDTLGLAADVTDPPAIKAAFDAVCRRFGGVDIIVSNAGAALTGRIGTVADDLLRRSFELNFFAHHTVAQAAVAVMRAQGTGGALLFNVSKQAVNPGPDFGPYGLPKAATLFLVRQYALDHGRDGIRANAVNADRIRGGMLTDALVSARAEARGLTPEAYLRGNLLGQEVTAEDVAHAFVHQALALKTTASVTTVDGGNIAAALR